ncbi:unnamed protein product [Linum trigynum]|uniref:Transposase n=1 Tax=Linum trigynum TaxID=586398 RepID=A0AAV2CFV4_9ROSI
MSEANPTSVPVDIDDGENAFPEQLTATPLRKYVVMVGEKKNNKWICSFGCRGDPYTGTYSRIRAHFLGRIPGMKAGGIAVCSKVTKSELEKMKQEEDGAKRVFTRKVSCPAVQILPPTSKIGVMKNDTKIISDMFDLVSRHDIDGLIGRFFYGCGIPFNVARSPFFYEMVRGLIEGSKGYKPPSSEKLRTNLLDKERSKVDRALTGIRDQWPTFGVFIVSNGWSNVKNQPLINVLAVSGGRAVFLEGIDCSGDEKTGVYIAEILLKAIDQVGIYNVVQVLTDNASACKRAGEIIMERHPHIFWSGCLAHTLSLLMKDIASSHYPSLRFIGFLYKKAKGIVKYIRNHSMVLHIFRKFSALDVIQVKKTRFGHHFVVLERLSKLKNHLISMVLSDEWESLKNGKSTSNLSHDEVKNTILDADFWLKLKLVLSFTRPIWKMISFCNSDKAIVGEVYPRMEDMVNFIQLSLVDRVEVKDIVEFLVMERWRKMNVPLHLLAYVLTPFYYSKKWLMSSSPTGDKRAKPHADPEIQKIYLDVVDRIIGNSVEATRARVQLSDFVSNTGIFARPQAICDRDVLPAVQWWNLHGAAAPELYSLAVRVLSQSVNTSCAERVWSTYSFIHSVKRNRLNTDRAESLVYVHYNNRLLTRYREDYEKEYKDWDYYVEDDMINFDMQQIEDKDFSSHDEDDAAIPSSSMPNPPQVTREDGRQPKRSRIA